MSPSREHPWGPGTPSITEVAYHHQQQEEARRAQRHAQKPRPSGGGKSNSWGCLIVIFIVLFGLKAMDSDDESEDQVQPSAVRPSPGPLLSWERTPESTADDDVVDNLLESWPDSYDRFWTMPDEQAGDAGATSEQTAIDAFKEQNRLAELQIRTLQKIQENTDTASAGGRQEFLNITREIKLIRMLRDGGDLFLLFGLQSGQPRRESDGRR